MPLRKPVLLPEAAPAFPQDLPGRRLLWAVLVSVLVNVALWHIASEAVQRRLLAPPVPITFRRVILSPVVVKPKTKPRPKAVHKTVKLKLTVKSKPVVRSQVTRQITRPRPVSHVRPVFRPQYAPPATHHYVLIAKGASPARQAALPGGHAELGQPIAHQNIGEGTNNDQLPTPQPRPAPTPEPQPQLAPQPKAVPQSVAQPQPLPAGPTQDAQPSNQVNPDIPDELKSGDYKSHVRVKVDIQADGSFVPSLITSSGNEEVDRRALDALKRWRWKPAVENGKPIRSTQRFRFDFEVN